MADWQVYLMMTAIVWLGLIIGLTIACVLLIGKKLMFFDSNKKKSDDKKINKDEN